MKLVHTLLGATTILSVGACRPALTPENADEVTAQVLCRKHRACDTNTWDEADDDRAICEDRVEDDFDGVSDFFGLLGGEVDLDELDQCLSDVRAADCETFGGGSLAEVSTIGNDCDDVFGF
jgi:hypothetical protein